MMNHSTTELLKAMKLSAMAAEFEKQLTDTGMYQQLSFEERFGLLVFRLIDIQLF